MIIYLKILVIIHYKIYRRFSVIIIYLLNYYFC